MALSRSTSLQATSGVAHGTGSYSPSSFTPGANARLLALVYGMGQNSGDTLSGASFTLSDSQGYFNTTAAAATTTHPGWGYGIAAFKGSVGASPAATTITVDCGAFNVHRYRVEVYEWQGANQVEHIGTFGYGSDANGTGAASATLNSAPAATSEIIGALMNSLGSGTGVSASPGSGFSEIFDATETDWWIFQSQWATGRTSTDVPWADVGVGVPSGEAVMLAIEILAADSNTETYSTRAVITRASRTG